MSSYLIVFTTNLSFIVSPSLTGIGQGRRPSVPKARYSEISIFRKMFPLAKFRNILSGTKHSKHFVCTAERRRSPGYHAYKAIFVNLAYSGFEYGVGYHSCEGNHRHYADLA